MFLIALYSKWGQASSRHHPGAGQKWRSRICILTRSPGDSEKTQRSSALQGSGPQTRLPLRITCKLRKEKRQMLGPYSRPSESITLFLDIAQARSIFLLQFWRAILMHTLFWESLLQNKDPVSKDKGKLRILMGHVHVGWKYRYRERWEVKGKKKRNHYFHLKALLPLSPSGKRNRTQSSLRRKQLIFSGQMATCPQHQLARHLPCLSDLVWSQALEPTVELWYQTHTAVSCLLARKTVLKTKHTR